MRRPYVERCAGSRSYWTSSHQELAARRIRGSGGGAAVASPAWPGVQPSPMRSSLAVVTLVALASERRLSASGSGALCQLDHQVPPIPLGWAEFQCGWKVASSVVHRSKRVCPGGSPTGVEALRGPAHRSRRACNGTRMTLRCPCEASLDGGGCDGRIGGELVVWLGERQQARRAYRGYPRRSAYVHVRQRHVR